MTLKNLLKILHVLWDLSESKEHRHEERHLMEEGGRRKEVKHI